MYSDDSIIIDTFLFPFLYSSKHWNRLLNMRLASWSKDLSTSFWASRIIRIIFLPFEASFSKLSRKLENLFRTLLSCVSCSSKVSIIIPEIVVINSIEFIVSLVLSLPNNWVDEDFFTARLIFCIAVENFLYWKSKNKLIPSCNTFSKLL